MPKIIVTSEEKYIELGFDSDIDSYLHYVETSSISLMMLHKLQRITKEYAQLQKYLFALSENEVDSVPEGYHPRASGAGRLGNNLVCDLCKMNVSGLIGYEKDYPANPDLWICAECEPCVEQATLGGGD